MSERGGPITVRQVELSEANAFVNEHHRHHDPVVGHRFSFGAAKGDRLVGVAIVGRPVAKSWDFSRVVEVLRCCTIGDRNVCSWLYGRAARIARELGYERIQTYTLDNESGVSLRAAGWTDEGEAGGGQWNHTDEPPRLFGGSNRNTEQPTCVKRRWAKQLRVRAPDWRVKANSGGKP